MTNDIRLVHRVVGTQHVFTSPDEPGLYVAHSDRKTAEDNVPAALDMLRRMHARRIEKTELRRRVAAGA